MFDAIPHSGPIALRVNAVFAVELYIKSLDSHWLRHDLRDALGIDGDQITTKPNKYGHRLDVLFDHLDARIKHYLVERFASHPLNERYPGLRPMLAEYANSFAEDRYIFESKDPATGGLAEDPVELARFFESAVKSIPTTRFR